MTGFSTIVDSTVISPSRLNYDVAITTSSTVSFAYSTAGIVDKVGLQVVIYNQTSGTLTLSVPTGEFDNYLTYPEYCATIDQLQIPPYQTVTLITTTIGYGYTISAISAMVNVDGGGSGQLLYQSAPNNTAFIPAGTSGYILESQGASQPPAWTQLVTGNLVGGVAGSLDYQSAPSETAKSAAGTAFSANGGGMASMLSSTSCGWMQTNFFANSNANTYSAGVLTLNKPRGYTFSCSSIGGSSGNLPNYLTAQGIPIADGNKYVIWNNTGSTYQLTVNNVQNYTSWNSTFVTGPAAAQYINLYPNESVVLQQYNSTYFTIESTTQSQNRGGAWTFAQPANQGAYNTLTIGTQSYDPFNWGITGQSRITPNVAGTYAVTVSLTQNKIIVSFDFNSILLFKNAISGTPFYRYRNEWNGVFNSGNVTSSGQAIVTLNGTTDYIAVSTYLYDNTSWGGGTITMALLE